MAPKCKTSWSSNWNTPSRHHKVLPLSEKVQVLKLIKKNNMLWLLRSMIRMCVCVLSHIQLWDPMDCSPPGSSVHGILQARILQWVAIPFSRASSRPRDRSQVSCIAGRFFPLSHQGSPKLSHRYVYIGKSIWCTEFDTIFVFRYLLCVLEYILYG